MFTGQYEVSLDAWGRFMIPSRYTRELRAGENVPYSFAYVARETLCIYTDHGFMEYVFSLYDKLTNGMPVEEATRFRASQGSLNTHAKYSRGGTAKIPKELRKSFCLPKRAELILAGCGDHFEIWKRSLWMLAHRHSPKPN